MTTITASTHTTQCVHCGMFVTAFYDHGKQVLVDRIWSVSFGPGLPPQRSGYVQHECVASVWQTKQEQEQEVEKR